MTVILVATMSLDGFIARPDDSVGPIFDWFSAGDTDVHAGDEQRPFRTGKESADWMRQHWGRVRSGVIGRHLFDHTNGWEGRPPAGDHVVVLTHTVPTDWAHYGTAPFTFVTEGIERAVATAKDQAGDGDVTVTAGDIGGQALAVGLIDEVEIDLAPVVLGRGKRFFGEDAPETVLEDPHLVVPGRRVTHFRYRVRRCGPTPRRALRPAPKCVHYAGQCPCGSGHLRRSAPMRTLTPLAWPDVPAAPPRTMTAIVFDEFGPPEVLHPAPVDTPAPGPGEVLVRVAAVCVGRFLDVALRAGRHPVKPALPHVPGVEHAGTVAAVGEGVSGIEVGQHVAVWPVLGCGECEHCAAGRSEACARLRIAGVHAHGAYAEYTVVPTAAVWPIPAGSDLDPATAAGVALAGPVAMNQLRQAGLRPGDWVLVQGAASALGATTAELARHLGARVIGTSRAAWKRERLTARGLDAVLDPTDAGFVDEVRALTGGAGIAVAVDDLGEPDIFARTTDVLAPCGALVSSGAFLGGRVPLDLARLYTLNQRVLGVRTGNAASARALWEEVARGFRPVVDRSFPLTEAAAAHRFLEADENMGRIVLTVPTD